MMGLGIDTSSYAAHAGAHGVLCPCVGVVPMCEDNLSQLKTKVEAMIAAGRVPVVFLDLDETLNRRLGTLIEAKAVTSLRTFDAAGACLA
jgi:hypothetical protein